MYLNGSNTPDPHTVFFQTRAASDAPSVSNGSMVSLNSWHYVVGVRDHTGQINKIYYDGQLASTSPATALVTYANSCNFGIGARDGASGCGSRLWGFFFTGLIDESRASNVQRSADWIKTEYNNQSAPSTFVYVGQRDTTQRPASTPSLKTRGNVKFR